MGRRRDEGEPLEVEFFDVGDLEDEAVEFGRGRARAATPASESGLPASGRGSRRSAWIVAGAIGSVGALVAVGVLSSGGDDTASAPSTTVERTTSTTQSPPTTVAAPVTTVASSVTLQPLVVSTYPPFVPDRPSPAEIAELGNLGPLAANFAPGLTLYLWDTRSGPSALVAYDLGTGASEPLELDPDSGLIKAVLPTSAGPVVDAGPLQLLTSDELTPVGWGDPYVEDFSVSGPRIALGPEGHVWVRTINPDALALFDLEEQRNVGRYELPLGVELIGSTAEGEPVIRGADLVSYRIADDGVTTALSDGITTPVEQGRYAVLRCAPPTACTVTLQGGEFATTFAVDEPADLERMAVRFSPDGRSAAVTFDGRVRILGISTAEGVEVPLSHVASSDPVSRPAVNYFRLARELVWTPDSLLVGMLTETGIVFVARNGEPVANVVLDPTDPLRYVPVALG